MTEDKMFAYAVLAWCFLMVGTLLTVAWHLAQGMAAPSGGETHSGSTEGNSPIGSADAP